MLRLAVEKMTRCFALEAAHAINRGLNPNPSRRYTRWFLKDEGRFGKFRGCCSGCSWCLDNLTHQRQNVQARAAYEARHDTEPDIPAYDGPGMEWQGA